MLAGFRHDLPVRDGDRLRLRERIMAFDSETAPLTFTGPAYGAACRAEAP